MSCCFASPISASLNRRGFIRTSASRLAGRQLRDTGNGPRTTVGAWLDLVGGSSGNGISLSLPVRPGTTRRAAFLTRQGWPMRSCTTWAWMATDGFSTSAAARGPLRDASRRSSKQLPAWILILRCSQRQRDSAPPRESRKRPGCENELRHCRRVWDSSGSLPSGPPFTGWTGHAWRARYARCSRRAGPLSRWMRPATEPTLSSRKPGPAAFATRRRPTRPSRNSGAAISGLTIARVKASGTPPPAAKTTSSRRPDSCPREPSLSQTAGRSISASTR